MKHWYIFALIALIGTQLVGASWEDVLKDDSENGRAHKKQKIAEKNNNELGVASELASKKKPSAFQSAKIKELIREITLIDSTTPDSDPWKSLFLSHVAEGLSELGDLQLGESMALRACKLAEKIWGANSEVSLNCKQSLIKIFESNGDYDKAIQLLNECDTICTNLSTETKNSNKEDLKWLIFPAIIRAQMADIQLIKGQFNEAKENLNKAMELAQQAPKSIKDFTILQPYSVRAKYSMQTGDYSGAEAILKDQLNLLRQMLSKLEKKKYDREKKDHFYSLNTGIFEALLNLHKAYVLEKKINDAQQLEPKLDDLNIMLSMNYTTVVSSQYLLDKAIREYLSGQEVEAYKDSRSYLKYTEDYLDSALGMVESQRLAWEKNYLCLSIPVAFCSAEQIAGYIIKWKGVVLDSLISDRKSLSSAEVKDDCEKLTYLKQQLVQLQINSPRSNLSENIKKLQDLIFNQQRKLAAISNAFNSNRMEFPSLSKVRNSLDSDSVVIEYVSYRNLPDYRFGEEQLGAMLITKNTSPVWVPLGKLDAIRKSYNDFRTQLTASSPQNDDFKKALSDLYQATWNKISTSFPQTVTKIYISPDSFLSFLPFSCLVNPDGKFLAEKYSISYVCSSRDLLTKVSTDNNKEAKFFANPLFDSTNSTISSDKALQSSSALSEYSKVSLPPLPGTQAEAENLSSLAKSFGWSSALVTGADATKKALAGINSPSILHLATHGFYLGGETSLQDAQAHRGMTVKGTSEAQTNAVNFSVLSPMVQSGIALTGAQTTLNLWKQGKAPDPANDGILTAEDVGGLNLNGTWLVTLSACETGVGEARSGEGVFGLRRAFMMAGAQNLLMTLWPVSDETTPLIMADFYKEALATHNAPEALAKVQRDWLVKLRKEKGLLAAVRDAGPFAMVVMANPNAKNQEPVKQSSAGTRGMKVVAVDEAQKNTSMESQPHQWSEDHIVVSTYPKVN